MSDCINGCLTDTFNYINDVCGQLTFALYTLFTFFARVNWLTDGWTEPTFTLLFLTYCPTHTTSTATSHISFHFHIHYCFRRATQVSFSSFFTFTTDGKLSTVNLCAWVYVCVWQRQFSSFLTVPGRQRNKWWHWQLSSLVYLILL